MKSYPIVTATLAACALFGATSTPALDEGAGARPVRAAGERPAPGQLLRHADTDGDGKVSLAEIHAKMPHFPAERFAMLDKNADGFLDKGEISEARPAMAPEMMEKLRAADTNQDRRVSQEEFAAQFPEAPAGRFVALDRNGDGFLDRQDRDAPPKRGPADGAPSPDVRKRADADARVYLEKLVRNHDQDGDGRLTMAELSAAKHGFPETVFGALDRNGDGVLTQADAVAQAPKAPKPPKVAAGEKPAPPAPEKKAAKPHGEKKKGMEAGKKHPSLDANKDGTITFEEAKSVNPDYTRERFDKHDKNHDGVITKADREQK